MNALNPEWISMCKHSFVECGTDIGPENTSAAVYYVENFIQELQRSLKV